MNHLKHTALTLLSTAVAVGVGVGPAAAAPTVAPRLPLITFERPAGTPLGPAGSLRQHRPASRARCARAQRLHRRLAAARCHPGHRAGRPAQAPYRLTPSPPPPTSTVSTTQTCDGSLVPTPANIDQVRGATLCLINRERANAGLGRLSTDDVLQAVAQRKSQDMVARNYFDHTSPSGETAAERVLNSGYVPPGSSYSIGENIAFGTLNLATPSEIVNGWMHSAGHRANILNPAYRQTGIGVAPAGPPGFSNGQAGGTYTQEFGTHD